MPRHEPRQDIYVHIITPHFISTFTEDRRGMEKDTVIDDTVEILPRILVL